MYSSHIYTTWEEPFSPALYVEKFGSFNTLLTERRTSFPDAPCGYGDVWKLAWQKVGADTRGLTMRSTLSKYLESRANQHPTC